jgi:gliding motility-associated-like protein
MCFAIIIFSGNSFAQNWGANTFSQTANEAADVEVTSTGESYIAGYFSGQTSFGQFYSFSASQGSTDIYVTKYAANGSIIWLKDFGGAGMDKAVDVAIGPDQNIVVTGSFFGTVTFGATTLTSNANSKDIFVMKMDPAGNVLWARKEGGAMAENSYKVTIDSQNNIILTGEFQGNATLGSGTFNSLMNPSSGNPSFDIFVQKYDPAGVPLWTKCGFADYEDRGLSVDVDNANNIFLTGQFSDTLLFAGNTYTNNSFNVGYLCKMNPAGDIQFFNMLKAGLTVPYDVEVNQNNEPVIIGDFLGNLNYYHQNGTTLIQNPYDQQIFTIKTGNTGNYIWNNTLGSSNTLSARSIAIDQNNSSFITGYFECDLSQLQDTTENLFSSVGFRDPYVMKIDNSGNRASVKQFGSQLNDEGKGIATYQADKPIVCGSYTYDLNFQTGGAVTLGNNTYSFNPFFGSEPYHIFLVGDQSLNSFVVNHVHSSYNNYDFFDDPGTDSLVGHLTAFEIADYVTVVNDTVHFCLEADLHYDPLTYDHMGPTYTYQWYDGTTYPSNTISATGDYWIRTERSDDCEFDIDTIHGILEPPPSFPLLTDDHGINVLHPGPDYLDYHFCAPEDVELTFSNLDPGSTITITGATQSFTGPGPHVINSELQYSVHLENQYCISDAEFVFDLDFGIPPEVIDPDIVMNTLVPTGDSIEVCQNVAVLFHGIDLLTNINANWVPQIEASIDTVLWEIDGGQSLNIDTATTVFVTNTTGWHTVELTVVVGYDNLCGVDTVVYHVTRQFYIKVNPLPTWQADITGTSQLCPGISDYLIASNPHPSLHWTGPTPEWTNGFDSLLVNSPGWYTYAGTISDSITGCSLDLLFNHFVGVKLPPEITSNIPGGIMCPSDSMLLAIPAFYADYTWISPNGDTLSTTSTCWVYEIGDYTVTVTDNSGCVLVSNAFEVLEYSTPSVTAEPGTVLCANQDIVISVAYSGNATFHWLNNNSTADSIIVNQPGTYVVEITQCGVTVTDSVVIMNGSFNVNQILGDLTICNGQDGVFFVNTGTSAAQFEWLINGNFADTLNPLNIPFSELIDNSQISVTLTNDCYSTTIVDTIHILPLTIISLSEDSLELCQDEEVIVEISPDDLTSYTWSAPFENETGTEITVNGAVSYPVITVIALDNNECPTNTDTLVVFSSDHTMDIAINFPNFCPGTEGEIVVTTNSDSIQWQTPFGYYETYSLQFPIDEAHEGTQSIVSWDSFGCSYTDNFTLTLAETPNTSLLPDTIFCANDIYTFYFPNDTNSYTWLTYGNSTSIPIIPNQDLILQITTPQGCVFTDTLNVQTVDCSNPLPNVITPNGDGVNDFFYLDDATSQLKNEIFIVNRWGEQVFYAAPYQNNFSGEELSEGVYFYIYYPNGREQTDNLRHGFLHLIE